MKSRFIIFVGLGALLVTFGVGALVGGYYWLNERQAVRDQPPAQHSPAPVRPPGVVNLQSYDDLHLQLDCVLGPLPPRPQPSAEECARFKSQ